VGVLYKLAPNIHLPWRFITPGSLLFTVVWLIATVGFGLYVANFSSYNKTYGALGGVVVLLTWLYLTNLVLLLGAEINALIDEMKAPEETKARRDTVLAKAKEKEAKRVGEPKPGTAAGAGQERAGRPEALAPEMVPAALAPQLPVHINARTNANGHHRGLTDSGVVRTLLLGGAFAVAAFGLKRARE
jgi:membrane protein